MNASASIVELQPCRGRVEGAIKVGASWLRVGARSLGATTVAYAAETLQLAPTCSFILGFG